MIITISDFVGDISIAGVENTLDGIASKLQLAINKYEPEYLKFILGKTLYEEYILGLLDTVVLQKWIDLSLQLKEATAYYVYFKFYEKEGTKSSSIGEVVSLTENSIRVSQDARLVTIWNEMVVKSRYSRVWIIKSINNYNYQNDDFYENGFYFSFLMSYKNRFGL